MTSFSFLGGFFNKATAYTLERIFTQNTSEDIVLGKEVPFGGLDNYIIFRPLNFRKTAILGTDFDRPLVFFAAENRFNMGML